MNANERLDDILWSEPRMQTLLGCAKKQLRRLTLEEGLPGIRLERGLYVYKAPEVLNWIESRKTGCRSVVSDSEDGLSTP